MKVSPPEPIRPDHDLQRFCSGDKGLDDWLRRRALQNQSSGASRTFVVCEEARCVLAYYSLASGSLTTVEATGRFRRNMPEPIPVAILARLAVDERVQGGGVGRALVKDAALRLLGAASTLGIRGIVVHAISEDAASFYKALGFTASAGQPRTFMVTLADLNARL